MSGFYENLQGTASRLLNQFKQGTIRYIQPGAPTGPDYDPHPGTPTPYTVDATVRGVEAQYVDNEFITSSDLQVVMAVFDVEPSVEGRVEIDGREHQVIRVRANPAAGVTVSYTVFVKG